MSRKEENKRLKSCLRRITDELRMAEARFPRIRSPHEGYAIIKEELDEAWEDIKRNELEDGEYEMVQVAAMALRYIIDLGDK